MHSRQPNLSSPTPRRPHPRYVLTPRPRHATLPRPPQDLLPSAEILAPFLDSEHAKKTPPTVTLIQNGIGIEHPIQVAYPKVPIISTVSWIGTNLFANEAVPRVSHGKLEKLVIGLYRGEGEPTDILGDPAGYTTSAEGAARLESGLKDVDLLASLLANGGGTVEVAEEIQAKRYAKTLWNASFGIVCALSRSAVSAVVAPDLLGFTIPVVRRLMLEVTYIARAFSISEIDLPLSMVDDVIKMTIKNWQVADGSATPATPSVEEEEERTLDDHSRAAFKPSILLDLEAGRPMELESILGSLIERARVKGVETPRLDTTYAALKINQEAALAKLDNSAAYHSHLRQWVGKQPFPGQAGQGQADQAAPAARVKLLRRESANVAFSGGKSKLTGKPVATMDEAPEPASNA